jgi:hypothetical protein
VLKFLCQLKLSHDSLLLTSRAINVHTQLASLPKLTLIDK